MTLKDNNTAFSVVKRADAESPEVFHCVYVFSSNASSFSFTLDVVTVDVMCIVYLLANSNKLVSKQHQSYLKPTKYICIQTNKSAMSQHKLYWHFEHQKYAINKM